MSATADLRRHQTRTLIHGWAVVIASHPPISAIATAKIAASATIVGPAASVKPPRHPSAIARPIVGRRIVSRNITIVASSTIRAGTSMAA